MRGIVIHAEKDLRIDTLPEQPLGPSDVRVRIEAGGICGSDLHYYNHGGIGLIRVREPMVLGHEIAGVVEAVGPEVSRVTVGTRVAVNPSRPCGRCRYCQKGLRIHCTDMRFLGSAMRMPHVQGGFRERLVVDEQQAVPVPGTLSTAEAAMAEPLAVCLHAVARAGSLVGKRVLVTGCGPIGALTILAARQAGALHVTATDIQDFTLAAARTVGADRTVDTASEPGALADFVRQDGPFDVLIEASGNASALRSAIEHLRPRGIVVQLGLGGDVSLPMNLIVTRELDMRGTFRFDAEFALAVDLMGRGRIDVKPLLTATLPIEEAEAAFRLAGDRGRAMKVQLSFG